jgi:hypothetical protein
MREAVSRALALPDSSLFRSARCIEFIEEEFLVDGLSWRHAMLAQRPPDRQHDCARNLLGQPQHPVTFLTEGPMHGRERGAESDGTAGKKNILGAREERLKLVLTSALPSRNEEQDRCFV